MYLRAGLVNFKTNNEGKFIVFSGGISPTSNKINDSL